MPLPRLIPCLDVAGGRVVKGVRFQELRDVGDPVELGVPGMLMLVGLVGWMMTTIRNAPWPPIDKAASLALVAGAFVIINLSYGIWQGWWVAALFFAATFCVGAMPLAAAQRREAGVPYRPATVKH